MLNPAILPHFSMYFLIHLRKVPTSSTQSLFPNLQVESKKLFFPFSSQTIKKSKRSLFWNHQILLQPSIGWNRNFLPSCSSWTKSKHLKNPNSPNPRTTTKSYQWSTNKTKMQKSIQIQKKKHQKRFTNATPSADSVSVSSWVDNDHLKKLYEEQQKLSSTITSQVKSLNNSCISTCPLSCIEEILLP